MTIILLTHWALVIRACPGASRHWKLSGLLTLLNWTQRQTCLTCKTSVGKRVSDERQNKRTANQTRLIISVFSSRVSTQLWYRLFSILSYTIQNEMLALRKCHSWKENVKLEGQEKIFEFYPYNSGIGGYFKSGKSAKFSKC